MIVDVDQLARKAVGKEAGDEQRHITEPLQAAFALGALGASSASDSICTSGLSRDAVGDVFEQLLRTRKQSQQIDHVVLGLVLDRHVLVRQRALQRVVKIFAQIANSHYPSSRLRLLHESIPRESRPRMHPSS